jgi:hypothetical protein
MRSLQHLLVCRAALPQDQLMAVCSMHASLETSAAALLQGAVLQQQIRRTCCGVVLATHMRMPFSPCHSVCDGMLCMFGSRCRVCGFEAGRGVSFHKRLLLVFECVTDLLLVVCWDPAGPSWFSTV